MKKLLLVLMGKVAFIDKAVTGAMDWIDSVGEQMDADSEHAYKATKAVLQALRDRLPVEEVFHLSSQLPLILKGVMLEDYDPTDKPIKAKTVDEFMDMVSDNIDSDEIVIEEATRAVLRVLYDRVSEGQMDIIKGLMPEEIKHLFTDEETDAEMEI